MCGRFMRSSTREQIAGPFRVRVFDEFDCSYNIAPSESVLVVDSEHIGRNMKWGLIPSWSKDSKKFFINARAETVASKPSFRDSYKSRRCLVVANGFYEWKKETDGSKQPMFIQLKDGVVFGFAGIWDCWQKGDQPVYSCSILTTEPNGLLKDIHNRMPVILADDEYETWLNQATLQRGLDNLLKPFPEALMEAWAVSTKVNSPRFKEASCMRPLEAS